jgi:hypothetical protein
MKNIHLIPTDKPSRLHLGNSGLVLCESVLSKYTINGQHICITNDEEIKEGDWFYNPATKEALYASKEMLSWNCNTTQEHKGWKKIILTTDQDLIADGVQAIDDKFLNWFVNNPSCEFVEWDKNYNRGNGKYYYKIIIPQEEPKTGYSKSETEFLGIEFTLKDGSKQFIPKQETLEDKAKKFTENLYYKVDDSDEFNGEPLAVYDAFIEGANWQSERCYSEEEAIQLLIKFNQEIREVDDVRSWFEQFKKK